MVAMKRFKEVGHIQTGRRGSRPLLLLSQPCTESVPQVSQVLSHHCTTACCPMHLHP